ncbi:MAG: DUF2971 domain-containing protein [Planctomycetaceae bacterium]|nr:DUF2971 domain-containing protein [Planctomycetaceae bacterium]
MKCRSKLCDEEFAKRSLRCPACKTVGVEKLYKYRAFSPRTLSILTDREVFFPSAHKLNDPFEFDFHLKTHAVHGVKIDRSSLDHAKAAMKNYGVLALSDLNNNVLMWSHYGDEHRGLCLEFTRTDSNDLGKWDHCMPVLYCDELPSFQPLELEDSKSVTKVLTSKGRFWEYEQEWRILSYEGNKAFPFPGDLTGVVFGFAMPQDHRDQVTALLGDSVQYYDTSRSTRYYALDVTSITA